MPLRNIARIAQLVEHLICNQDVVGSTPTAGSIISMSYMRLEQDYLSWVAG